MPRFAPYHTTDKNIGVVNFDANRRTSISIPVGHRFERFDLKFDVTATGTPAATGPNNISMGGYLGLIRKMFIRINGNEERHVRSGHSLFMLSHAQMGQDPIGFVNPVNAATINQSINLRYHFSPMQLIERSAFTLDLLNELGDSSRISNAELVIDWGDVGDVWDNPGTMAITAASMTVEAVEQRLTDTAVRSLELHTREFEIVDNANNFISYELPRIQNSQLVGLAIAQVRNDIRAPFNFADLNKRIVIRDDEYSWRDRAYWQIRQTNELERGVPTPENMLFMDLAEFKTLDFALSDANFSDNLRLELSPRNFGAASDRRIKVYQEFIKRPTI